MPGGHPSMMTTLPGPWDSPAVVTRNACPKLLPAMGLLRGPRCASRGALLTTSAPLGPRHGRPGHPEAAPRRSTKTLNRAPRRSTMFSMSDAPRPLTQLDEEQLLFRDAVLGFARERIAPLVHDMDATATLDRSLLPELFRLGVMGIEIPEEYGGAGSSFFNAILAVEALATVDASVSVLVD